MSAVPLAQPQPAHVLVLEGEVRITDLWGIHVTGAAQVSALPRELVRRGRILA